MRVKKDLFENHVKIYEPGSKIFQEGDRGEELYVIIEGEVEIRKSTYTSASKTLIVLQKGDIFGEMALIEKKTRSATAVALKKAKLLVINETFFEHVIETNPDFSKKMIRILSERLRRANSLLQSLIVTNKENMIMKGLYEYAEEYGTPTFTGYRVNQESFMEWALNHLGVREKDMNLIIQNLLKKEIITPTAVGKEEFILKEKE